jgi:hypothetical protein
MEGNPDIGIQQALTLVQPPSKLIPSLPDIAMEVGTYLTKGMYPFHTTDDRGIYQAGQTIEVVLQMTL